MENIKNENFESGDKNASERHNKDEQGSAASIGAGSSDQGIEPSEEGQEDEFNKDITGLSEEPGFFDGKNEVGGPPGGNDEARLGRIDGKDHTNSSSESSLEIMEKEIGEQPEHGLVEEGPGPDS